MLKRTIHFLFLFASLESISFAQQPECMGNQSETLDKNNSTLTSCDAAKIALLNDVKGNDEYRKKLNAKLAESVAKQAKQILADLGTNSNFYEQNNDDFILSSEVNAQCKFEFIKDIEKNGCNQKNASAEEKEKIKMLTDALSNGAKSTRLFDSLANIYAKNKYGMSNGCPVNESDYPLRTIMTPSAIQKFILNSKLENNKKELELLYDQYPQFEMIARAGIKDKFESYMRAFDLNKDTPKKYLARFFGQPDNKILFGKGIANRCRQMQSSITSFICHDIKSPVSKNANISKKLFNGYNPAKEYQDQKTSVKNDPDSFKTYGYLCLEKQQANYLADETAHFDLNQSCENLKNPSFNSVDHWYRCFENGTKASVNELVQTDRIERFCARYSCQSPEVKSLLSCKNGGPISSQDYLKLDLNDNYDESEAEFIAQLENQKKKRAAIIERSESITPDSPIEIKKSISTFDLSAFGADAVTNFLDLPDNQKVAAVIQAEMKEKGIGQQTREQIQKIVNREDVPHEAPSFNQQTQLASNEIGAPLMQQSTQESYNHDLRQSFNSFEPTKSEKIVSREEPVVKGPAFNEEAEQMKKDIQALMNAKPAREKEPEEEPAPKIEKAKKNDNVRGYAEELRDWSSDLRRKESELSAKEIAQWNRDREQNFRQNELDKRERELFDRFNDPKTETKAKTAAAAVSVSTTDKKIVNSGAEVRLQKEREELQVKTNGLTVSPEKLEQLEKKDLTDLGVNIEEPFIIRVVMKGKSIPVRVSKMKKSNGKTYLAPYLNEDSKEIKEAILKSPIFKEFRYYLDQHLSPYSPLKKGKN